MVAWAATVAVAAGGGAGGTEAAEGKGTGCRR
uniref:Uncharacterized protein n=1 Tax=Arundo donax TaxID=35708 RepID=A0A0A9HPL2_ARUDO